MESLTSRARALYRGRHYAELAELLAPLREELLENAPYLAFYLADAWRRLGRQPDALALVQSLAGASRRSGIPRLELDRLNLAGMLYFETGDMARAEQCWRELLDRAAADHSDDFVARANNNLGIIYTLSLRVPEAVMCYQRALSAYQAEGATRGLAQSHQNLAITYRELEQYDDADTHFTEAIRLARLSESEDEVARAEQERGLLIYLRARDAVLARVTARRALSRFARLGDPTGASDSQRVLAMIELGEGDTEAARMHGETALQHARAVGHLLLEAELLEVLAATARKERQPERAADLEQRADDAFAKLHARAWGQHLRAVAARL
ncbi:MAG TPA: tetratricopeptide repeat protein [Longimicrobiales bacterium]